MRKVRPVFYGQPVSFQLFAFIFLLLMGVLIGLLVSMGLLAIFPELSDVSSDGSMAHSVHTMRILQITNQIGLFILPPLAFVWLFYPDNKQALRWEHPFTYKILIPGILLMFVALPLIHRLNEINQSICFPESLQTLELWFQQLEEQAKQMTELFLLDASTNGLIMNLLMIALIPAIGEELVFRSVLQPIFIKIFKNAHWGIIITALVFSLMHFQFYGLIARMLLGVFLGYFFYWSKSIFIPILMHLANNAAAVISYFLYAKGWINIPMEEVGAATNPVFVTLSVIACLFMGWIGLKISKQHEFKNG